MVTRALQGPVGILQGLKGFLAGFVRFLVGFVDFLVGECVQFVWFWVDFDAGRFDGASRSCLGMLCIAVSDQVHRPPKVVGNSKSKI